MQQHTLTWTLNGEVQTLVTPWAGGGRPRAVTLIKAKPLAEVRLSAADYRAIREASAAVREAKATGQRVVRRGGTITLTPRR